MNVLSEKSYDKTVKQSAMKVMKMMHDGLGDKYKLFGQGKLNVKAVRDVCLLVGRWILMLDCESGSTEKGEKTIKVIFMRSKCFHDRFEQTK